MMKIELEPQLCLLERFYADQQTSNTDFELSIYDRYGHCFSGKLHQLDNASDFLVLRCPGDDLLFIRLSEIAHFKLHNALNHSSCLSRRSPSEVNVMNEIDTINIVDLIDSIQEQIRINYHLAIAILTDKSCEPFIRQPNIIHLLKSLESNLVKIAKDDFLNESLQNISTYEIHHKKGDRLRFKKNGSKILLSIDLSIDYGFKLSEDIESNLNKVL